MRLKKITLQNITSLRGHHEIDFDKIYKISDLFAITGQIGSGKSSILVAISLALFGKSYKKALSSADFITQGEHEGNIVLSFDQAGHSYECFWSCKVLKKDGTAIRTPSPKREIFKNQEACDEKIEEILGLNFDQFCKTVVLNQGEFHRFITSNFSERKDILEKLIDSSTLSNLGSYLTKKLKNLEYEKDLLKKEIDCSQSIPVEVVEENYSIINNYSYPLKIFESGFTKINLIRPLFKDILININKEKEVNEKINKYKKELNSIFKNLNEKESEHTKVKTQFEEIKNNFEQKRGPLQNAIKILRDIDHKDNLLLNLNNQIEMTKEKINKAQELESINLSEINQINENITNIKLDKIIEESFESLEKYIVKVRGLKNSLDEKKEIYNKQNSEFELLNQKKQHLIDNVDSINKQTYNLLKELGVNNKEIIDKNKLKNTIADKENLLKTDIKNISIDIRRHADINEKLINKSNEIIDLEQNQNDIFYNLKESEKEVSKTSAKYEKILNEIEQSNREISISNFRLEMNESKKCPVCLNNILEEVNLLPKNEAFHGDFQNLQLQEKDIKKELNSINETVLKLKQETKTIKEQIEKAKNEKGKLEIEKDQIVRQWCPKSTELSFKKLTNHETHLDESLQKIDQLKRLQEKAAYEEEAAESQKTDIISKRKSILEYKESVNKINDSYNQCIDYIKSIFSLETKDFNQLIIFYNKVCIKYKKLKELKVELIRKKDSQVNIKNNILENTQFYDKGQKEQTNLIQSIEVLKSNLKLLKVSDNPEEELEQLHLKIENYRDVFESSKKELLEYEKERDQLRSGLSMLNEQVKSLSLERTNYKVNLNEICERPVQSSNIEKVNINIDCIITLNNISKKLESIDLDEEFLTNFSLHIQTQLDDLYDEIEERRNTTRSELNKATEIIKIHEENKNHLENLKVKYNQQESLFKRFDLLNQVIGKNEFRNYALTLIEHQLIGHANVELGSLCDGRYQMQQISKKHGSDYYIIDRWNNGEQRKISTLSGGETFLISLAMALALADLSRGTTEIDSFFIDEGFGTLDEDSINDVLEVLLSVRSRGKQIGIISHIKNLTDRIPVNVNLIKDQINGPKIDYSFY